MLNPLSAAASLQLTVGCVEGHEEPESHVVLMEVFRGPVSGGTPN